MEVMRLGRGRRGRCGDEFTSTRESVAGPRATAPSFGRDVLHRRAEHSSPNRSHATSSPHILTKTGYLSLSLPIFTTPSKCRTKSKIRSKITLCNPNKCDKVRPEHRTCAASSQGVPTCPPR